MAVVGAVTAISAAGLTGVQIANAATDTSSSPMSSLVDAVASKFNLNKAEVQAVFDEQHEKMHAEREADLKEKVAQLVTDGKLTQAQANALNAKRAELQAEREANRESFKDMTRDERKAAIQEKKETLTTWLDEQGIDQEYAYLLMGGRGGHGPGHGGRM